MESINKKNIKYLIYALIIGPVLLIPLFNQNNSMQLPMHLVIMVCIYIFLSESWNILAGLCGLFSLGHVAFYGIGAYCLGIAMMKLKLHPFIGVIMGIVISVIFALVLGAISSKLTGFYFTMSTLALGETLRTIATQWINVTNGSNGIPLVRPIIPRYIFFYAAILLAILSVTFFIKLRKSRIGSMFVSIRENENLSKALGVNTNKYKTMAAIISAGLASIAGAFITYYIQVVDTSYMSSNISNKILIVVIIGGMGNVWGPILGSVIILLEEVMRGIFGADYAPITIAFYSVILIFFILAKPGGIISVRFQNSVRIVKKIFADNTIKGI